MQLTTHFNLDEFLVSQTAARLGIDNTPTDAKLENIKKLACYLEEVRLFVRKPIHISSGYRSPALNKNIPGSSKNSAHCLGLAADCRIEGMTPFEACELVSGNFPGFDQIIYEFGPSGWMHVGLSNGQPRGQLLSAVRRMGQTFYLPGLQEDLWRDK
jgi:zinc D-Ala-D-Ala carboxypeptidase